MSVAEALRGWELRAQANAGRGGFARGLAPGVGLLIESIQRKQALAAQQAAQERAYQERRDAEVRSQDFQAQRDAQARAQEMMDREAAANALGGALGGPNFTPSTGWQDFLSGGGGVAQKYGGGQFGANEFQSRVLQDVGGTVPATGGTPLPPQFADPVTQRAVFANLAKQAQDQQEAQRARERNEWFQSLLAPVETTAQVPMAGPTSVMQPGTGITGQFPATVPATPDDVLRRAQLPDGRFDAKLFNQAMDVAVQAMKARVPPVDPVAQAGAIARAQADAWSKARGEEPVKPTPTEETLQALAERSSVPFDPALGVDDYVRLGSLFSTIGNRESLAADREARIALNRARLDFQQASRDAEAGRATADDQRAAATTLFGAIDRSIRSLREALAYTKPGTPQEEQIRAEIETLEREKADPEGVLRGQMGGVSNAPANETSPGSGLTPEEEAQARSLGYERGPDGRWVKVQ